MQKYDYRVSFEEAVKQGIPKEEYARESSKNVILTWIANELAEANRLKRIEIESRIYEGEIKTTVENQEKLTKDLEDQAKCI